MRYCVMLSLALLPAAGLAQDEETQPRDPEGEPGLEEGGCDQPPEDHAPPEDPVCKAPPKLDTLRIGHTFAGGDEYVVAAERFAYDADQVHGILTGFGYAVQQWSVWNGDPHAPFDGSSLLAAVADAGDTFWQTPAPEDAYHEYFLYYGGHGQPGLLDIKPGHLHHPFLPYADLYAVLGGFPPDVIVTVFIDACYSGTALDHERTLASLTAWPATPGLPGLTVMTSTGANTCPSGLDDADSATDDFVEVDVPIGSATMGEMFDAMDQAQGGAPELHQEGELPSNW